MTDSLTPVLLSCFANCDFGSAFHLQIPEQVGIHQKRKELFFREILPQSEPRSSGKGSLPPVHVLRQAQAEEAGQ